MRKARVIVTRQESIDDVSPGDSSQEITRGIMDKNYLLIGVDHEGFPLVLSGGDDVMFHL